MSAASAIAILTAAYPRAEFPAATAHVYGRMLADIADQDLVEAVDKLIRTSRFLPTIAEIRLEVAEARLALPTPDEAWDMALAGLLFVPEVRATANAVGGMWEINHGDRPEVTRRAFRENYAGRRATAIRHAQLGTQPVASQLPQAINDPVSLNERRLREIPESTSIRIRPIALRTARRRAGLPLAVPTEEERQDAIRVLEEEGDPGDADDPLYVEAFRVFDEAGR